MTEERFADLQLLRYDVPGFTSLPLRQKLLVYYLSEAALLGRDILWDQNCRYGLRVRQVLEAVYTNYDGPQDNDDWQAFVVYLKRVWFSNGIHHHYTYLKFEPGFSREFFLREVRRLDAGTLPLGEGELMEIIFNPDVMPKRVNQTDGEDLLLTSSSNYYAEGITQNEAEAFYARLKKDTPQDRPPLLGLNSRLERRDDGTLFENVWRSGGLYGEVIDRICKMLSSARKYAENDRQCKVIDKLVEFYRTGNLKTFDEYAILWVGETQSEIDFTNGFTEVYGDPLGLKASWEGYVNIIDHEATRKAKTLSDDAAWFEKHSPVDRKFKKKVCRGVTAKVISAAMLGGDLYPSSAIGINLPNSNWIREEFGSKSVTIANLTRAYNLALRDSGIREEFVIDEVTRQLLDRYGDICDDLHTLLHECLGHGSGQLLPGVDADALRSYGSTLEEARADLFGLYYIADRKLVRMGLTPDGEAYKSQYYSYLMNGLLTQMARIEEGGQIEEAHMRNRALISRWTLENYPQAVQIVQKNDRHYVRITDYEILRKAFGELLCEVQRIKSEGDYEAARRLVEHYGIKLDAALHHEIRERYQRLDLAPYKGFINPRYQLIRNGAADIVDVSIHLDEAYDKQMLRYSKEYSTELSSLINDLHYPTYKGGENVSDFPLREGWERSIKSELRQGMNGVLSARMREAGMPFRLIYGVELPRLQAIAGEFPSSADLASYLWEQDIRETRLLAIMLMPPEAFTWEMANHQADTIKTAEEAQVMAMMLMPKASKAKEICLAWLEAGRSLPSVCACLCLRHLLLQGMEMSNREKQTVEECILKMQPKASLHLRKAIQVLRDALAGKIS